MNDGERLLLDRLRAQNHDVERKDKKQIKRNDGSPKKRRLSKFIKVKERRGDVRIKVSPLMIIMAAAFILQGRLYDFVCSLAAVILHECAHARVGRYFGYALNEIKLMPYGAALCGDEDLYPRHEILIALAGPAFNLVLGLAFAAMWWLIPQSYAFTGAFCECNIYIGLFNLLPIYPLDGGRVLHCLFKRRGKGNVQKAMRIISAVVGSVALLLFVLSAVLTYLPFLPLPYTFATDADTNYCLLTVGIFMVGSALFPEKHARYISAMGAGKVQSRPIEVRKFVVGATVPLSRIVSMTSPQYIAEFCVADGDCELGAFSEKALVDAVNALGYAASAADVLKFGK